METSHAIHADDLFEREPLDEDDANRARAGVAAAYSAYTEALKKAGVLAGANRLKPPASAATTVRIRERQVAGAQWPLRGRKGAARRLLHDRRARPRRRAFLGRSLPRRELRRDRSASNLGDVDMQYLLLMYQSEAAMRNQPQDRARQVHGAYMAYGDALRKAGVAGRRQPACSRPRPPRRSVSPTGKPQVLERALRRIPRSSSAATT